ncbi:hypothetical protein AMC83_PD00028 (plasmid) [Rhizobium phaseoli]|uniref:Predicted metal-binding membrane protein n=2 Tax=Rhizobium TaxID=379 RepID=A0A1C3YA83_9HYPH|nr:hypothetical protein AMK02_PC00029 [Rhizobium sp. N731]ANL18521.1 hypothetical protein AMJ97_PC00029 [Rhizobium sp. N1314]ANL37111.1 hypothetical protein AMC89_PC00029 [Rhizobium phaseoli]ARQ62103.1 hypothetical protein Kim5_PD00095 [Rhizobium sp. Kim5]SCB61285.1 Predicted metal-binding membrane protein [Rhizobium aethiopicum]
MRSTSPAVREWRRGFAPLALAAGSAWIPLAVGGDSTSMPTICSAAFVWSTPSPKTYAFFFSYVSPLQLIVSWAMMVMAMMLPTLSVPLRHVRERSFWRVRPWAELLFVVSYLGTWMVAGIALLGVAITLRLASTSSALPLVACLIIAFIWQISPWKQVALNRCHRRPSLAAFPPAAYENVLAWGMTHGLWCIASCWGLMLLPLLAPSHHLPLMAIVAVYIWAERLEPACAPRWQFRVPSRAIRLIARNVAGWRQSSGSTSITMACDECAL